MRLFRTLRSTAGFSALEMLMAVSITMALGGMATLQIGAARPAMKADGALRVLLGQMRIARELAITERRFMRVNFDNPGQIQIVREEVPGPATTVVATTMMEGGFGYWLIDGVPDTPDAFGRTSAIDFGAAANVKFTPDGTLVNQDGAGANGTVFFAMPDTARSVRAVTVLGSTGRIRGYRWDGRGWRLV